VVEGLESLYECGLTLAAWQRATAMAPFEEWRGTRARCLACRLLEATGAPRQSARFIIETWRADRKDPSACFYFGGYLLRRRGPLPALDFVRRYGAGIDAPLWHALESCALTALRDFEGADRALRCAEARAPNDAWLQVCRATLLVGQDRYPEALAAAQGALALAPDYPAAIQATAQALLLVSRDAGALELLESACARLQNGPVAAMLAAIESDLDRHDEARRSWERVVELSPAMEPGFARWLCAKRSDAAFHCGDIEAAIELARASQIPFQLAVAARMEKTRGRRVALPARFVRQHEKTCVPATLIAISELWHMPADHLQVAGEICYDGTAAHSERRWAEENGWRVREFTVTWDAARMLLDRGIAFTLTTVEPGNAHEQAVIGYDERRGVLLLRDPFLAMRPELDAEAGLAHYAPTGPRGMAMVPLEHGELLDGIELPDSVERDLLHVIDCSLHVHDREGADAALKELVARSPDHLLALQGRRALAAYDSDPLAMLECADALSRRFPNDANYLLLRISALRDLGRRAEVLALLEEKGRTSSGEPLLWSELAAELKPDARQSARVVELLRRTIRARPTLPAAFHSLADVLWDQGRREDALRLYWFATCLDDKNEAHAMPFYLAARALSRNAEALRVLLARFDLFGGRSSLPAQTLFLALAAEQRRPEGLAALDRALELRPTDLNLLLFSARENGRVGRLERAEALLQRAATIAKSPRWHRVAADMASYRLDLRAALEHWQAVLRSEPLAVDAHEAFARLLAQMQGRAAALDHFTNVCARFPHHYRLRQLWLGWLREDDPTRAYEVARMLCDFHPDDAWARRELAISLGRMGRVDEGLDEVEIAARLEPRGPMNFNLRGNLLENAHRPAEAQEQFRASLRLDVDQPWTIAALLRCCPDATAQRREVEFLRTEIRSQVLVGQSLLELQKVASTLVPAEELLADLESARTLRPELWEAWSACIQQLLVLRRLDAALDLAAAAVDRFPLLANAFRNLAAVHRARGDRKGERAALEQAVQLEPGSSESVMTLAESWEREGDRARAKELLQRLVAAAPLDAAAHAFVAQGFWKLGDKDLAIERLEHALRVNQESSLGWAQLGEWVGASKVAEFARHLTREKSWSCGGWLALAKFSPVLDERLDALAHAETCQPLHIEVHDLRALVLAEAGRFTEAFAACAPDVFGAERPIELRAREASIHAYQGDRDKAIAAMLEVVASDPSFLWAIRCLIDWYREAGEATRLLEMAALGCNQDPTSAYLQGCVAEGKLLERNSAGAKLALQRAMELNPAYRWAGLVLLDLYLGDGELLAASEVLAVVEKHHSSPEVWDRAARLALHRGDRSEVEKRLYAICMDASEGDMPLRRAAAAVASAGEPWANLLRDVLERVLGQPSPDAAAGAAWVEHVAAERRSWRVWRDLRILRERGLTGSHATEAYLRRLAETRGSELRLFLSFHREALQRELATWAAAGFALVSRRAYRAAAKWLADYASRSPEPWMVINAIVAFQTVGRDAETDAAIDFALALDGARDEERLQLWAAFRKALAGAPAEARALLAQCKTDQDLYGRFLRQAALAVASATDASLTRSEAFRDARRQISAALDPLHFPLPPLVRAIHARAVRVIARRRGGLLGFLWGTAQRVIPV